MNHRPAAVAPALFAICGLLVMSLLAGAGRANAQTPPFDAEVVEANTQVRSGAGRAYYEVGTLEVGAKVVVEAELFGWYKIECPPGVFCFVERKNVNVRGDGSLGVIETDGTPINAAHATKGPADSYRNLMKLNAGDTVEIVEEVNNAYKIKPPKNAYVFLPPGSIKPVDNAAPAPTPTPAKPDKPEPVAPAKPIEVETPEPPVVVAPPVAPKPKPQPEPEVVVVNPPAPPTPITPEPAPETTPTPEREEISFDSGPEVPPAPASSQKPDLLNDPTVKVPLPDVEVQTQATNEMLRAVEVAMLPYLSLPVDEQPIAKMVRGYADAAQIAQLSDNDMAIVQARLTQLERNRELATALAEADAVTAEVNDAPPGTAPVPGSETETSGESDTTAMLDPLGDAELPADGDSTVAVAPLPDAETSAAPTPKPAPVAPAAPLPPGTEYDAVGILTASTVHTGANQPVLLRLLDPTGKRTVAYLEPDASIDTVQMIGRIVGIVGESIYDPTTKLNLIRPTRVDVLSAN